MAINSFKGEYGFLSNFYLCNIVRSIGAQTYNYASAEHAYQAAKALDIKDHDHIRRAPTPAFAKSRGRRVTPIAGWDLKKLSVMQEIIEIKFSFGTELADRLLKTGDEELIEGNWWNDTFWGVCNGTGLNHLGKLLMTQREILKHV
jgi:hypothetical protein